MNTRFRLLIGLLLLSVASVALFVPGCGSSSSTPKLTNNPLSVEGTWKVTASSGGGSSGFSASIVVLAAQSGNCIVNTPLGIQFEVTGATTCFIADPNAHQGSITSITGGWDYPPAGFMFGMSTADPIPSNSTAQLMGFFVETDGTNVEALDINGTITANTKTFSGTFSCDANSPNPCSLSGSFTGVHQ